MKKLFLVVMICLIVSIANAETVKMSWTQNEADLLSLDRWRIYYGLNVDTQNILVDIQFSGQTSPYTTTQTIKISGTPGQWIRVYFAISAISKNGKESLKTLGKTASGADSLELQIPFGDINTPQELIIELIVEPSKAKERGAPKKPIVDALKGKIQ